MTTILSLGREDHNRALSAEEFEAADYQPGFDYELIEGRLYVSPVADAPHDELRTWLQMKLAWYASQHSEVINQVTVSARIFLPDEPEETRPEPDVAAYANWPHDQPVAQRNWREVSPLLVAEVVSADDPDKDLVRNVRLYRRVPSIQEYWILDPRRNADQPTLVVRRRLDRRWQRAERFRGGETYTTPLLPGFSLVLDAHT